MIATCSENELVGRANDKSTEYAWVATDLSAGI